MKTKREITMAAGIGTEAVRTKTGKDWREWFAILDKVGARKMEHAAIARYLYDELGLSGWWSQMLTVGYEQERGLRKKHQTATGYHVSSSKTIAIPLSKLYRAFQDSKGRTQWLKDPHLVIRKANPNKNLRITWDGGRSSVEVGFAAKGHAKSQVIVDHYKLPNAKQAARMRAYWGKALEQLKRILAPRAKDQESESRRGSRKSGKKRESNSDD